MSAIPRPHSFAIGRHNYRPKLHPRFHVVNHGVAHWKIDDGSLHPKRKADAGLDDLPASELAILVRPDTAPALSWDVKVGGYRNVSLKTADIDEAKAAAYAEYNRMQSSPSLAREDFGWDALFQRYTD